MSLLDAGANEALRQIHSKREDKQRQLHCFVLDALGLTVCIGEPMNAEKLSLHTVECRIRIHQEQDPEYAKQCGIPAIDDPHREREITKILRGMRAKGLLKAHLGNRWSVVSN